MIQGGGTRYKDVRVESAMEIDWKTSQHDIFTTIYSHSCHLACFSFKTGAGSKQIIKEHEHTYGIKITQSDPTLN